MADTINKLKVNISYITLADICMAYRYSYYILGCPLISDNEYDKLEREAIRRLTLENNMTHPLHKVGSDLSTSYSAYYKWVYKGLYLGLITLYEGD